MKVYVFVSAANFIFEPTDIMDTQVFLSEKEAVDYLENQISELTTEEGGWELSSKRPRHYQLNDGDMEYVAYVAEREI